MIVFCTSMFSCRCVSRLAATLTILITVCTIAAQSQTPPYALIQDSTLTATTNTINVTQLPVVTTAGIMYVDLTIVFDVSANGTLTLASGYPQQTPAPRPIINGFEAGTYLGDNDSTELITVSEPGVAPNGVTAWSIAPAAGSSGCIYPYSAVWYDVGTTLKNNPLYLTRIKPAGITSTLLQYGVGAAGTGCGSTIDIYEWGTSSLLGFSQTGNILTVSSFTNNGVDQDKPVDTQTFTLTTQGQAAPQGKTVTTQR
jgi:hypothetical protein